MEQDSASERPVDAGFESSRMSFREQSLADRLEVVASDDAILKRFACLFVPLREAFANLALGIGFGTPTMSHEVDGKADWRRG